MRPTGDEAVQCIFLKKMWIDRTRWWRAVVYQQCDSYPWCTLYVSRVPSLALWDFSFGYSGFYSSRKTRTPVDYEKSIIFLRDSRASNKRARVKIATREETFCFSLHAAIFLRALAYFAPLTVQRKVSGLALGILIRSERNELKAPRCFVSEQITSISINILEICAHFKTSHMYRRSYLPIWSWNSLLCCVHRIFSPPRPAMSADAACILFLHDSASSSKS